MAVQNNKKVMALLPMKGHSERVPNKNIRSFNGEPLFFRILESLKNAKYIDQVFINTDSDEISKLATSNFDVQIIKRPKELIGDFVEMNSIINYDIAQIKGEHFLQTHATNPLLTTETIDNAIEKYFSQLNHHDSLFSVTKKQTRLYDEHLNPINHNLNELLRTQDLPPIYEENSNFYIFSKEGFKETNKRIGKRPCIFEVNKLEAIDIDEEEDFQIAELLYKHRIG